MYKLKNQGGLIMESFLKSNSVTDFENLKQNKDSQRFILIKFERTEIDIIRQISETGYHKNSMVPMIRQKTELTIKLNNS